MDAAGPSEVREAAEAFNEMQRRLRDLIAGRTQTLAAISHDLRTPITRLRLRLEFVGDAEQRAKFEADLEEMEKMIAAALALARDEAAVEARTRIDLSVLLAGLVADARALGQDAEYRGPARLDIAVAPISLKRAFANLIDNAVRYGRRAHVTLNAEAGQTRVDIEDDGPGIPESEQAKVFQPFYRLERSRSRDTGGTGLGLAVARTTVLAHGGTIALRNRAGGGLTVSVTLPM
jgi:signal transduction histidine kinase